MEIAHRYFMSESNLKRARRETILINGINADEL